MANRISATVVEFANVLIDEIITRKKTIFFIFYSCSGKIINVRRAIGLTRKSCLPLRHSPGITPGSLSSKHGFVYHWNYKNVKKIGKEGQTFIKLNGNSG